MAAEDWLGYDEWADSEFDSIACKYCGEEGLEWEQARGERNEKRWVLVTFQGDIHNCRAIGPALADEFEVEA